MVLTKRKGNKNDYDSPWKRLLENLLPDFLEMFFPAVHAAVDWSCKPKSRDKELPRSMQKALCGTQVVDKVVEVRTRDNKNVLLFIHIEVQAQRDENFAKRMFQYNIKLCERFGDNVESLAILADNTSYWKPTRYDRAGIQTSLQFNFGVAKLREVEASLNASVGAARAGGSDAVAPPVSTNPFAWVVRAHMASLQTKPADRQRFKFREELLTRLFAASLPNSKVREVVIFYEWVLQLSAELEKEFRSVEERVEGVMGKEFIPYRERESRKQGIQEGVQQEAAKVARKMLKHRLDGLSEEYIDKVGMYTHGDLSALFDFLLQTTDTAEIEKWFKTHPPSNDPNKN